MDRQNIKAIDFELFGGFDNWLATVSNGATTRASLLKSSVPWLAKAVFMTSNAIANIPFEIVSADGAVIDTSTDWDNAIGGMPNPNRTIGLIASSLCGGSAYLLPRKTSRMIVDLQYIAPHNIIPHITDNGIEYFTRTFPFGKQEKITPDNLVHFYLSDSDVEIGPPITSPMSDALLGAELLASMSATMKIYGDRGFVPAYIGSAKGNPSVTEREKTENYLTRFLRGAYNSVVKVLVADTLTLQRVGAGMEELKGAYTEIQKQAIEDIATAFGIPAALFMSDKAYATEMNVLWRAYYETGQCVQIYKTIEETFNTQILKQWKYRMQFKPESLSVFQTDENERANSVSAYVNAINTNPQVAAFVMSFMGVDLDEEQEHELEEIIKGQDEATEPDLPNEDTQPDVMDTPEAEQKPMTALSPDETKDLALWYSKAKSWNLKGKGSAVDWENKHLREEIAAPIRLKLAGATTELDIVKAFEIGEQITIPQDDSALKALAASIDAAVLAESKKEVKQAPPNISITMPPISLTAQMPAQGEVIVNVPQQPAPIVNVTTPENNIVVQPAQPAVNNITVKPADVNLPNMPTKATITTDARGKKTLTVED